MANRTGLAHGYVRLTCDDPRASVLLLLGEAAPRVTGGLGGWEITDRPRQVSMTTWQGVEPWQVSLAVMVDAHARGASIEPQLAQLAAVARGDGESEPGICNVQGVALPVVQRGWVIEALEYSEGALLDAASGERTRQALVLTLREYVPPEYLQLRRSATKGSGGKTKVISTRRGDTPARVAQRERCKWTEIRELNLTSGLATKASQPLKTGTKLRVPVAQSKSRKPATRRGT